MSTSADATATARHTAGAIAFRGPDAAKYLQGQLSADLEKLAPGTRTLAGLGLDIAVSRASTRANEAVDSFYVTESGPGGQKVPEARQEEVRRARLTAIA